MGGVAPAPLGEENDLGGNRLPDAGTAWDSVRVTETTPYDADRARFTRQALARLALCDHAVDVADGATGLVATENDPAWACTQLDLWARNRLVLVGDEHPVSSGLVMAVPETQPPVICEWRAGRRLRPGSVGGVGRFGRFGRFGEGTELGGRQPGDLVHSQLDRPLGLRTQGRKRGENGGGGGRGVGHDAPRDSDVGGPRR
ncbi:hypothetical protein [Streptomyces sp. NPDC091212]|uniref:hypothetical protein n=1 Tax=Streptomyces sp. NPDC091212 TaxID=3155191 RepID=UPI00342768D4